MTEMSPHRNGQTKMSCDWNNPDWIGQTKKLRTHHRLGQGSNAQINMLLKAKSQAVLA